jgi:hypothetical protein
MSHGLEIALILENAKEVKKKKKKKAKKKGQRPGVGATLYIASQMRPPPF